jgi:hypothetical protein
VDTPIPSSAARPVAPARSRSGLQRRPTPGPACPCASTMRVLGSANRSARRPAGHRPGWLPTERWPRPASGPPGSARRRRAGCPPRLPPSRRRSRRRLRAARAVEAAVQVCAQPPRPQHRRLHPRRRAGGALPAHQRRDALVGTDHGQDLLEQRVGQQPRPPKPARKRTFAR